MIEIESNLIIGGIIAFIALIAIFYKFARKKSIVYHHVPPSQSVPKRAKKVGGGYVEGVYHCEPCNVAGHIFTLGPGACKLCGEKMHLHVAKWSATRKLWIFRK